MFKTSNAQGSDSRDSNNNHDGKRAHGIMAEDECTDAPDTEMWDSFLDWATRDLEHVLTRVLEHIETFVLIFIDGLDEAEPEEQKAILTSMTSCLEQVSRSAFPAVPNLLVFRDIRMYAYGKFSQAIADDPGSSLDRHRLATIVSERAQGVFLWAMLAAQSLVRAIENGDDENCLQERLSTLSGKLEDFYLDMWNRYNDELPSYRRTAARYLNLMIIAPHCLDISTSRGVTPVRLDMTWLVGATAYDEYARLRAGRNGTDDGLEAICTKTRKSVESRCAGLLTFGDSSELATASVDFIHRSAYDFLTESEGE